MRKRFQMTCEEYADEHEDFFAECVDEMSWDNGRVTDTLFDILLHKAEEEGIVLSDTETWDYDSYFYNCYQCYEKGLS